MSKEQKEMYLFIVKTSNCPCNCCEERKTSERLSDLVCNAKVSTIIVRCKNASNRHQTLRVSLASSLYQHSMNYDSCTDNICFFHIKFVFLRYVLTKICRLQVNSILKHNKTSKNKKTIIL